MEKFAQNSPFASNSSLLRRAERPPVNTLADNRYLEMHKNAHQANTGIVRKLAKIQEASPVEKTEVEHSLTASDSELDDTLVAPNSSTSKLTAVSPGFQFNDREEWDNFSYDATRKNRGGFSFSLGSSQESLSQHSPDGPADNQGEGGLKMGVTGPGSRTSSVESVNSVGVGIPLHSSTPPVHKQLPDLPTTQETQMHHQGGLRQHGNPPQAVLSSTVNGSREVVGSTDKWHDPPPTSALMSKVFPGLKKQDDLKEKEHGKPTATVSLTSMFCICTYLHVLHVVWSLNGSLLSQQIHCKQQCLQRVACCTMYSRRN